MEADDEVEFDLIGSHFDREFDLSIDKENKLGEDYLKDFEEKQGEIEREVNEVKQKISELCQDDEGRRKWRINTQTTHLMGGLTKRMDRCHSNAFCKFYQILARFPQLIRTRTKKRGEMKSKTFRSLHLCEVPGHFLSAIDHFISLFHSNLEWKWTANSLNPHYEYTKACDMFLDDMLIVKYPEFWMFGEGNSGDVTKLAGSLKESGQKFDLVTADGSTYSLDHPEDQETIVVDILRGEVECAVESLREGGSFVMKVYSSFTLPSTRLFSLLRSLFKQVAIYKPPSSKAGNTERYVICIGFKRANSKKLLANGGVKQYLINGKVTRKDCESILASSRFFSNLQKQSMQNNIDLFASPSMSSEEVNILVDHAIKRVMKECAMNRLREREINSNLFVDREKRPWMKLFKDNHVETLKELEDKTRAEEFLSQKQVQWSMGYDRKKVEDPVVREVEWSNEQMETFTNSENQLLVPSIPHPKILHSLFIDPELWVAVQSVNPECITDMCRNDVNMSAEDFNRLIIHPPLDQQGYIMLAVDRLTSHLDWIKFLLYLLSQLHSCTLKGLVLLHPNSHSPSPSPPLLSPSPSPSSHPYTLILSRFSASVISFLTVIFYQVTYHQPKSCNPVIMTFDLPNYSEDLPDFVADYLRDLMGAMTRGSSCLSFVHLLYMAEVHPIISAYNNEMIKRVVNELLTPLNNV